MDWLNKDLNSYIDNKEHVKFDVRVNNRICKLSASSWALFFACLLSGLGCLLIAFVHDFVALFDIVVCATILFVVFYVGVWKVEYASCRCVRYVLTERGIYAISGLLFKKVKFVAYNKITDMNIHVGPFENLYGCASIGIGTASGNVTGFVSNGQGTIASVDELTISSVDEYKKIQNYIIKNIK